MFLAEIREAAFLKFAKTLASSERYGNMWFPLKDQTRTLRNNIRYEEFYARTERLYNSPVYRMRRLLNQEEFKTSI